MFKTLKKCKAFTLVELIAVITVLGIIALITVPSVNKAIIKSKEEAYNNQKSEILAAAKEWNLDNVGSTTVKKFSAYDVIFILDTSGSMEGEKSQITTGALNGIVKILMQSNKNNRLTITRAGFGSSVLLPLDHYTINNESGNIFDYNSSTINIADNIYNSSGNLVTWENTVSFDEEHEYFQLALKLGVQQVLNNYGSDGIRRKVLVMILSDGFPTIYHADYQDPQETGYVNSNSSSEVQISGAYYTILTYNYYKRYLKEQLNIDVPFYTVGVNMADGTDDESIFEKMFLNPTADNVKASNSIGTFSTGLYNLLTSGDNPYSDNYSYADKSYSGSNMTEDDILAMFKDALADAISDTGKVQIQTLIDGGFLDKGALTDPRTGDEMQGYVNITYNEIDNKYIYEYVED